jgi:hypothetical protein
MAPLTPNALAMSNVALWIAFGIGVCGIVPMMLPKTAVRDVVVVLKSVKSSSLPPHPAVANNVALAKIQIIRNLATPAPVLSTVWLVIGTYLRRIVSSIRRCARHSAVLVGAFVIVTSSRSPSTEVQCAHFSKIGFLATMVHASLHASTAIGVLGMSVPLLAINTARNNTERARC